MNSEQPPEEAEPPDAPDARGKPVGRRVLLGTLGLGALGVITAPTLQRGLESFLAGASGKDPTGPTGLLPNGGGFRYYSVTSSVPRRNADTYRLTVVGLVGEHPLWRPGPSPHTDEPARPSTGSGRASMPYAGPERLNDQ